MLAVDANLTELAREADMRIKRALANVKATDSKFNVSNQPWHVDEVPGKRLRSAGLVLRLPAMRQQLIDAAVQVVGQPRKNILQIRPGVMAMHLR